MAQRQLSESESDDDLEMQREVDLHLPSLARGSKSAVTDEHVARVSRPRVSSRAPMSAFQLSDSERQSQLDLNAPPRPTTMREAPYIIALVGVLLAITGVLTYLLLQ